MVAHQIQHRTDQKFRKNWGKQAGAYLKAGFYSRGASQSLNGLMLSGTGEPLTPRYLIQFLQIPTGQPSFGN
jgi:hypothetical protein